MKIMSLLFLFLIILKISFAMNIQGCRFCYTVQPSSQIECNPYKNISTKCTIIGPSDVILQIKWFYSSQSQSEVSQEISAFTTNYSIHVTQQSTVGVNTQETRSQLVFHTISIGHYWCQVFYGNMGLLASPKLEIIPTDDAGRVSDCESNSLYNTGLEKCDNIIDNGSSYSACPSVAFSSTMSSGANTILYISSSQQSSSENIYATSTEFDHSTINEASNLLTTTEMFTEWASSYKIIPTQSGQPFDLSYTEDSFHLWLYIVAALTGIFAVLIIILTGVCIGLCVTKPNRKEQIQQEPVIRPESQEFNHNLTRTRTSMTVETNIPMTPLPPELDSTSAYYDALELEQDYEDLDDETDKHFVAPVAVAAQNIMHPRYHEQGPSVATLSHPSLQPTYSEIGEATANTLSKQTFGMNTNPTAGYGKLDHSRPRQNYYPKRDSPLLSGYRKLEHIQAGLKATTLPYNPQHGYANIELPGAVGNHFRSVSLPDSEYSNLNPCPYDDSTEPNTPSHEHPRKRYANFDIIEAQVGMEEVDHSPHMSQSSDDYHMLSDATAEHHMQEEYEFLPNYDDEQSPDELHLKHDFSNRISSHHRNVLASFCKDPLGEQISVASQSSADFTGPFFFPHMLEPSLSSKTDHHLYKPLDISKMEPEQNYTSVRTISK